MAANSSVYPGTWVALRKESVDRNTKNPMICVNEIPSLSARRAWIEIITRTGIVTGCVVALRKESVDRNNLHCVEEVSGDTSLSARRAWIEMPTRC